MYSLESAVALVSYAPVACFFLALLLMATTLILIGACKLLKIFPMEKIIFHFAVLRRDTYEDYSFPLKTVSNTSIVPLNFDLHSLQNYAKFYRKIIVR